MKIGNKVWSKAASVALAATLGAFMCAPAVGGLVAVPEAWAEGNITITDTDDSSATYSGYQIFKGTVKDGDSGKTITNIQWSSDGMGTAVTNAITTWCNNNSETYTGTTAQDAADFISNHITGGNGVVVASDSFANALAKVVEEVSGATTIEVSAGKQATSAPDGGYYLFKTKTKSSNKTATSPIYAVIGGEDVTVTAKKSTPTIEKTVKGDDTGDSAGSSTDAAIGDELTYTLTGTLPSNYATYSTYKYEFTDTLSKGLTFTKGGDTVAASDVTVKVGDKTVGFDQYTVSLTAGSEGANVLKVSFSDLKSIKDSNNTAITLDNTSKIVVTYKATLNSDATTGTDANTNSATISYSNDPHNSGEGTSEPTPDVKTYTFGLTLNKLDLGTEESLDGAVFTIKNAGGKYVTADGSLTDTETKLNVTDGKISIPKGLEAGSYTFTEVTAPTNYSAVDSFTVTLVPTYATGDIGTTKKGDLTNLKATLDAGTQTDKIILGKNNTTTDDNKLEATTDSASGVDSKYSTVTVTVGDAKNVGLPITGMSGVTWTLVAGGAVLLLTIGYGVHASRKRRQEEQE